MEKPQRDEVSMTEELPLLNHWRAGYETHLRHLWIYPVSIFSPLEIKKFPGGAYLEREELNDVQHKKDTVGLRHGFRLKASVPEKALASLQDKSERSFKCLEM